MEDASDDEFHMEEDASDDEFDDATLLRLYGIDLYGQEDSDGIDDDYELEDDMEFDSDDETKPRKKRERNRYSEQDRIDSAFFQTYLKRADEGGG